MGKIRAADWPEVEARLAEGHEVVSFDPRGLGETRMRYKAASIDDPVVRKRAMHVVAENQRVRDFADALRANDLATAGELMLASHASLRDLYDTSTAQMDAAVAHVASLPGVHGVRMTGGGFGGCIVALAEPGALDEGWRVRAVDGARLLDADAA